MNNNDKSLNGKSIVNGNFRKFKIRSSWTRAVIKYDGNNNVQRFDWLVTWDLLSLVVELIFFSFLFITSNHNGINTSHCFNFQHSAFTRENNETIIIKRTVYTLLNVFSIHSHSNNIRPRKYLHIRLVKTIEKTKPKKGWKKRRGMKQKSHWDISHLNGFVHFRLFFISFSFDIPDLRAFGSILNVASSNVL